MWNIAWPLVLVLAPPGLGQENVLILVADDVGVDRVSAYEEHPNPGHTPCIDRLARRGVLFRHAWSSSKCSATRACVLTGRYGFRTGIGEAVSAVGWELDPAEWILPEVLRFSPHGPYSDAVLGKWHLGTTPDHPLLAGCSHHAGSPRNIGDYFNWTKNVDGSLQTVRVYATTDLVDDAIRAVDSLPEPWFLWVAFNAAHKPFHAPPAELHGYDLKGAPDDDPVTHMKAATEAMDTEIGRLIDSFDVGLFERTTIIFCGDNGTHALATEPPFVPSHAKGTVYEGGVGVPLIICGPRVDEPGSECEALVSLTDIFATVCGIAGIDPTTVVPNGTVLDSRSLLPYLSDPRQPSLRDHLYAERFAPNGFGPYILRYRAVRGERFKLLRLKVNGVQVEHLFDLTLDRMEQTNLLAAPVPPLVRRAYEELACAMEAWSGP